MNKLSEEVELIHSVNPAHRIQLEGAYGLMQLVAQINAGAEQYEKLEKSVFDRVHIAKAELEEEKNILAAIMAELPEAVVICNKEGTIILYNSQAKRYFSEKNTILQAKHPSRRRQGYSHREPREGPSGYRSIYFWYHRKEYRSARAG